MNWWESDPVESDSQTSPQQAQNWWESDPVGVPEFGSPEWMDAYQRTQQAVQQGEVPDARAPESAVGNAASGFANQFTRGSGDMLTGLLEMEAKYGHSQVLLRLIDAVAGTNLRLGYVESLGDARRTVARGADSAFPYDANRVSGQVGGIPGYVAPPVLGTLLTGGTGALATGAALAGGQAYGSAQTEAEMLGQQGTPAAEANAAGAALINAGLALIGGKMGQAAASRIGGGGLLSRLARGTAVTAGAGAEGAVGGVGQNVVAANTIDPTRKATDNIATPAALAAGMAGVPITVQGLLGRRGAAESPAAPRGTQQQQQANLGVLQRLMQEREAKARAEAAAGAGTAVPEASPPGDAAAAPTKSAQTDTRLVDAPPILDTIPPFVSRDAAAMTSDPTTAPPEGVASIPASPFDVVPSPFRNRKAYEASWGGRPGELPVGVAADVPDSPRATADNADPFGMGDTAPAPMSDVPENPPTVVTPRLKKGEKLRFSRADIENEFQQFYDPMLAMERTEYENRLVEGSASRAPFTFKGKTLNDLPGEVKSFLEGNFHLRKLFSVTEDATRAGGEDAMGVLGDDYWTYANMLAGGKEGSKAAALKMARKYASGDPRSEFLLALYDLKPPDGQKNKRIGTVDPEELKRPLAFKIKGIDVETQFDPETGNWFLIDGDELPPTPVDALDRVPVDPGTFRKTFGEMEREAMQAESNVPPEQAAQANAEAQRFYESQASGIVTNAVGGPVATPLGSKTKEMFPRTADQPVQAGEALPPADAQDARIRRQYDPTATQEMFPGQKAEPPLPPKPEDDVPFSWTNIDTSTQPDPDAAGRWQSQAPQRVGAEPDAPPARVETVRELDRVLTGVRDGSMTPEQAMSALDTLLANAKDRAARNSADRERVRGADFFEQKLLEAKRQGRLTPENVEFARWFLRQNPEMANDLGISIRGKLGDRPASGMYEPGERVVSLFSVFAKPDTTVHELLHHVERMLPEPIRRGIERAWRSELVRAYRGATGDERALIRNIIQSNAGNAEAGRAVRAMLQDGIRFPVAKLYHLLNPREFWAVRGTQMLSKRYAVRDSWLGQARQFFSELYQKIKGTFGFKSDAPILKGLKAALDSDGTFQTQEMMGGGKGRLYDTADPKLLPDPEKPPRPEVQVGVLAKRKAERVVKFITGAVRSRGNAPAELRNLQEDRLAAIAAYDKSAEFRNADAQKAIRAEFGKNPDPLVQTMFDAALKGDDEALAAMPESVRQQITLMRRDIDGMTNELLDSGLIPDEGTQGEMFDEPKVSLRDRMRDNLGKYVTRSYRIFSDKDYQPSPESMNKLAGLIAEELADGGMPMPAAVEQAQGDVRRLLVDVKDKGVDWLVNRMGQKNLGILKKRKDLGPEIREFLGENTDVSVNYLTTMTKMANLLANHRFLQDVKSKGVEGGWLFESKQSRPGFDALISREGDPRLAPLDGMRTSEDIRDALRQAQLRGTDSVLYTAYMRLNYAAKAAKTVGSVVTQVANLASQPVFNIDSGHWNFLHYGKAGKATAAGSLPGADAFRSARDAELEFIRYGLAEQGGGAGEVLEAARRAGLESPRTKIGKAITAPVRFAQAIYAIPDPLGKKVGWLNAIDTYRRIFPEMSLEQVKEYAAQRIKDEYPTYGRIAPNARKVFLNQPFVGNFASFTFEMWRTQVNKYMHTAELLRMGQQGNRAAAIYGAKRLVGHLLVGIASTYGVQELSRMTQQLTRREDEGLRSFLPEWQRNSFLFYNKVEPGVVEFTDFARLNPAAGIFKIANAIVSGNAESIPERMMNALQEVVAPIAGEGIITSKLLDVARNRTQSGRPVSPPGDQAPWLTNLAHILSGIEPGTSERFRKRLLPAIKGEQPAERQTTAVQELLSEVTGLRKVRFDFDRALQRVSQGTRDELSAAHGTFLRSLQVGQATPAPDVVLGNYLNMEEARFRAFRSLRLKVDAAKASGMTDQAIIESLKKAQIAQRDARAIIDGRFVPYDLGGEAVTSIRQSGRNFDMTQLREAQARLRQRRIDK